MGMNQLILNLPWPPSNNSYWRHPNKGPLAGRTLISEKGRAYRVAVDEACRGIWSWDAKQLYGAPMRLSVALYAYPPDKRRRDLDNLPKAVLDALTHAGVWADDEQIDALSIQRCDREKDGRIKVVITEIEQCETRVRPGHHCVKSLYI
jgi:crossover junction endodeoxyribonuclease RusA